MKKRIFMGMIAFCAMFLMLQVTSFAKEANVSVSVEMEEPSGEVENLLEMLTEPGDTTYECDFVKAEEIAEKFSGNDKIHVLPYLDMQIVSVEIPQGEFQLVPLVVWDISAKYDVVESEVADDLVNPVVIQAGVDLPLATNESVAISVPYIDLVGGYEEILKIKHLSQDGKEYYYVAEVVGSENICFTAPGELGRFALMVDGRCVAIQFEDLEVEDEWDATDIHFAEFPTMEKDGYIFKGWNVEGLSGLYTGVLTEELLNELYVLSFKGSVPIVAKAVFETIPVEDEPEEEPTEKPKHEDEEQEDVEEAVVAVQETEQEVPVQAVGMSPPATGDSVGMYWYVALLVITVVGMRKMRRFI